MTTRVVLVLSTMHSLVNRVFENIPSNRLLLQLLVDQFCEEWVEYESDRSETEALACFHGNFLSRTMRNYRLLKDSTLKVEECCYLGHTDDELRSCDKRHMEYDSARNCAYF